MGFNKVQQGKDIMSWMEAELSITVLLMTNSYCYFSSILFPIYERSSYRYLLLDYAIRSGTG